jgi:GLPGLI family protein
MKTKIATLITLFLFISNSLYAQDPTQKVLQGLLGSKNNSSTEKLPDTYAFDWLFKTKMEITGKKKSKNTETNMNFFLNTNKDYYGMDVENEDMKKSGGKAVMVFDFKEEAMVMFADYGGQNMAMLNKLKDPTKKEIKEKDRNYSFKEIGTKTILGYECYGMEVENKDSLVTLWFTLDVLKEDALLMEMEMIDKKKGENIKMTAISLEEQKTEFHKKDYQFMKMGF